MVLRITVNFAVFVAAFYPGHYSLSNKVTKTFEVEEDYLSGITNFGVTVFISSRKKKSFLTTPCVKNKL